MSTNGYSLPVHTRPTAAQLLSHHFVRNQTTVRATNVNITREAFCAPSALELHSNRTNNNPFDRDDTSSRLTILRNIKPEQFCSQLRLTLYYRRHLNNQCKLLF